MFEEQKELHSDSLKIGDTAYYFDAHYNFIRDFEITDIQGDLIKSDGMSILKDCVYKTFEDVLETLEGY